MEARLSEPAALRSRPLPSPPAPPSPAPAARVPIGLEPGRAWRWCVLTTLRDARFARRRARPMSRPSLERLFARRWARAAPHCEPAISRGAFADAMRQGRRMLRAGRLIRVQGADRMSTAGPLIDD